MRSLIVFAVVAVVISQCASYRLRRGIISHESGGEGHGHGATSYQNVHIENFHPVPVYIKHGHGGHEGESKHRIGSVQHNVKVSHGHGKHDYGHAIISGNVEGHGHGEGHSFETIAVGGHAASPYEKSDYQGYENNLEHAELGSIAGYGKESAPQYELQYEGGHGASEDAGEQHGYGSLGGGEEYSQLEGHESH